MTKYDPVLSFDRFKSIIEILPEPASEAIINLRNHSPRGIVDKLFSLDDLENRFVCSSLQIEFEKPTRQELLELYDNRKFSRFGPIEVKKVNWFIYDSRNGVALTLKEREDSISRKEHNIEDLKPVQISLWKEPQNYGECLEIVPFSMEEINFVSELVGKLKDAEIDLCDYRPGRYLIRGY